MKRSDRYTTGCQHKPVIALFSVMQTLTSLLAFLVARTCEAPFRESLLFSEYYNCWQLKVLYLQTNRLRQCDRSIAQQFSSSSTSKFRAITDPVQHRGLHAQQCSLPEECTEAGLHQSFYITIIYVPTH